MMPLNRGLWFTHLLRQIAPLPAQRRRAKGEIQVMQRITAPEASRSARMR